MDILESMRICPMCNSRIVLFEEYLKGGCRPCLFGAPKEKIKEVESEINFRYFHWKQDKLREKLKEEGRKNIPDYICPSCNKELIVRVSRIDEKKFWGCSAFPSCRYTHKFWGEKVPEPA